MYYYKVIVANKLGKDYFFYKSEDNIPLNAIVKVPLRNKELYGLCIEKVSKIEDIIDFDINLILHIICVYNITIPESILNFVNMCNKTTFLTINDLVGQLIDNTCNHLGKAEMKKILLKPNTTIEKPSILDKKPRVTLKENRINYYIDIFIVLRIIYLIRSHTIINNKTQNTHNKKSVKNIIIFFPEIKMLDRYINELKGEITKLENKDIKINTFKFTNTKGKESRALVNELLNEEYSNKLNNNTSYNSFTLNIIFTTKLGIFLPYKSIEQIIVVNESSSFYIQEQNSLYYDLRELVYVLSTVFSSKLDFISRLPSLRLYNYSNNALSFTNDTSTYINKEKFLKMQICKSNFGNSDESDIFSFQILETLCDLDD